MKAVKAGAVSDLLPSRPLTSSVYSSGLSLTVGPSFCLHLVCCAAWTRSSRSLASAPRHFWLKAWARPRESHTASHLGPLRRCGAPASRQPVAHLSSNRNMHHGVVRMPSGLGGFVLVDVAIAGQHATHCLQVAVLCPLLWILHDTADSLTRRSGSFSALLLTGAMPFLRVGCKFVAFFWEA